MPIDAAWDEARVPDGRVDRVIADRIELLVADLHVDENLVHRLNRLCGHGWRTRARGMAVADRTRPGPTPRARSRDRWLRRGLRVQQRARCRQLVAGLE